MAGGSMGGVGDDSGKEQSGLLAMLCRARLGIELQSG